MKKKGKETEKKEGEKEKKKRDEERESWSSHVTEV